MKYILFGLLIVSGSLYGDVRFPTALKASHYEHPDAMMVEQQREQQIRDRMFDLRKKQKEEIEAKMLAEQLSKTANTVAWRCFRDVSTPLLDEAVKDLSRETTDGLLSRMRDMFFEPTCSSEHLNELPLDSLQVVYRKAHEELKSIKESAKIKFVFRYTRNDVRNKKAFQALQKGLAQATEKAAKMAVAVEQLGRVTDKIIAEEAAKKDKK